MTKLILFYYYKLPINTITSDRIINNAAEIFVISLNIPSRVLLLPLPKKVSAPPEILPDKPYELPS